MTCSEPGPEGQGEGTRGYMHWVSRGVHTDKYTLRAGRLDKADDETHCKSIFKVLLPSFVPIGLEISTRVSQRVFAKDVLY